MFIVSEITGTSRRDRTGRGASGCWNRIPLLAWSVGVWLLLVGTGPAQTAEDMPAVEAGRKALSRRTTYPWYDAQQDTIRRIDVKPPKTTAANRNSKWESKPVAPMNWSPAWGWLWEILKWVFWAGLIGLLVFLIVMFVRAFGYREGSFPVASAQECAAAPGTAAATIESLPFQVPRPESDLLAEARRLYEAGRYGEAIIYLFSHQLVQLNQHQLIRLARGKTNRQYVGELRQRRDLRELLVQTMVAFEDVFFGRHELDRSGFEACWLRLDEFQTRLEEATNP